MPQLPFTKQCPDDKILNPETNRCVSKTGAVGRKLIGKKLKDGKKTTNLPAQFPTGSSTTFEVGELPPDVLRIIGNQLTDQNLSKFMLTTNMFTKH